nr:helix-turn-helix transcriptional regulator [uncultured Cellulosilyticum sp.]
MSIVDKIQHLCNEKKITKNALEVELGFGRSTISKWDKSSPSMDKVQKVADYFHVSVDYLLGRENNTNFIDMDVRRIERARKNMPQKEKDKMMKILQASFEEYFSDNFEDDDLDE